MNFGKTNVVVCKDAADLGRQSAKAVADTLRTLLKSQKEVRAIFAAGESQTTFFASLARETGVEWSRVVCFNLDDFWDPRLPDKFTCGYQTRTALYDLVHPKRVEQVRYAAPDAQAEADRFGKLFQQFQPFDLCCMGIGTSGHIALCEPGQTDLHDPRTAVVVDLVETSKHQLRTDPNFRDLGYIPEKGVTLTIPALMSPKHLFSIVPLALKRPIMTRVLAATQATADLPATVLRDHPGTLFLDRDSCPVAMLPNA